VASGQPDPERAGGAVSPEPDDQPVDWDRLLAQLADQPREDGWVTLQEASGATGVARSTLRAWYRTGQVPSRMVGSPHGPQRLVPLEAVLDRALQSSRVRRQLEHARSLEAEVAELRARVDALERRLGMGRDQQVN
jgi:transposase